MTRPADRLVALAADGLSRARITVALGASRADSAAWAKHHETCATALADANTLARAGWTASLARRWQVVPCRPKGQIHGLALREARPYRANARYRQATACQSPIRTP